MHSIHFISRLPSALRGELEQVFYFNALQQRYAPRITANVDRFGEITIAAADNELTLDYVSSPSCQTLFAVDSLGEQMSLLGVIGYVIKDELCEIVHIAVTPACALNGEYGNEFVAPRLMEKVRKLAKEKRVKQLQLPYRNRLVPVDIKFIEVFE